MEKDHLLCEQARAFQSGGSLHMPVLLCSSDSNSLLPHGPEIQGKECPMYSRMSTTHSSLLKVHQSHHHITPTSKGALMEWKHTRLPKSEIQGLVVHREHCLDAVL
jgi:hypothetical protein